ncbi:IMP dehydrogenase [Candidatus Gottesmanbacteria bacterium RBG_16_37_8]|uniref:IMP dehydrogenase n=1 Tax=Candidatus Gottesmanbacteria bacterium RBG_16_37_8 TaxID=1798371 RepID=A0A1F5YWK1_9BACT|nr:MAG: IMP dehydrogenase [Candidatus Gottesmanbacteria bacterium RBG_16_37_8]
MDNNYKLALTYDDVLLVPKRSKIAHRRDVSTKVNLTRDITLEVPFISANMDTVTESKMAISLAHNGGIGIIHRFMSVERQVNEVKKVKRHEGFILYKPFTLLPWQTVREANLKAEETKVSSFIIIDEADRVQGILTRRDLVFAGNFKTPVSQIMTPFNKLITASYKITYQKAKEIILKNKIEKLPLVDENKKLKGLITAKSIEHLGLYPRATTDKYGRLRVGAAVGAVGDFLERTKELIEAGCDVIVVDVAHGHNEIALSAVKKVRSKYKDVALIGGNVATSAAIKDLIKLGVDAIKVGIGPGGLCTTRIVTGIGMPQFTAVRECSYAAKNSSVSIIADGGTNFPGDITKALAAGSSACMLAGWFAGTDEAPGGVIMRDGLKYKVHRGAASFLAVADRKIASEEITSVDRLNTIVAEGVEALVPYKGSVNDVIDQLLGALRSGMSYCNANSIKEMQKNAEFVRITESGLRESKSHNVKLI